MPKLLGNWIAKDSEIKREYLRREIAFLNVHIHLFDPVKQFAQHLGRDAEVRSVCP